MLDLFLAIMAQLIPFLPLAIGISISYTILKATDLSLDGSFVLGAGIFAKFVTLGVSPYTASLFAIFGGALVGSFVSFIQRGGKVDPLLAGVLVVFILTSLNLIIMGRPNISLLSTPTPFSNLLQKNIVYGWSFIAFLSFLIVFISFIFIQSKFGLILKALGDNPEQLKRIGYSIEFYRTIGFAFTNLLAAFSGVLTAQIYGYADIGMGLGVTLTGICAILLGSQFVKLIFQSNQSSNLINFLSCIAGVFIYFAGINILLRLEMNPIYLKMTLGLILIFFLRVFHDKK
jgi:putative ABC transport system permease protein